MVISERYVSIYRQIEKTIYVYHIADTQTEYTKLFSWWQRGSKMKECPNCSMELPDEAHYCPRCMFQYEKQEIQIKDRHRKHIPLLLIGSVLVIGVFICMPFVRRRIQDNMNSNYWKPYNYCHHKHCISTTYLSNEISSYLKNSCLLESSYNYKQTNKKQ